MHRKSTIGFLAVIMVVCLFSNYSANAIVEYPDVNAGSAVLMESVRGQILYQKEAHKKVPISSMSKIMTALLVIEKAQLGSNVIISNNAVNVEGSQLNLEAGGQYALEDLLYAILLTTANDAAVALAEHVAGSVEEFVSMMNAKARELNLNDTFFKNPTGLYDENQYSTAYDAATLVRYAIKNSTFNNFFSYKGKPFVGKNGPTLLLNQNMLFWQYEGVDGGKIGYSEVAGYGAITTATRNNRRLICVVLNSSKSESMYDDSVKMLDYGFENFRTGVLVSKNQPLQSISIGDFRINLVSQEDVYYTFPVGESYVKDVDFKIRNDLKPPIKKDTIMGTARYILIDDSIIEINLFPDREIIPPRSFYTYLKTKYQENRNLFILVAVLVVIEIIMAIFNSIRFLVRKIRLKSGRDQLCR